MPTLEIYGPLSAGAVTAALKDTPYSHTLALIRNSKNVTDVDGKSLSIIRIGVPPTFPPEGLIDMITRLTPLAVVEVAGLVGWYPQTQPQPAANDNAAKPVEAETCS